MLRLAAYGLLFCFLAITGMIALEFHVGLELYRRIADPPPSWHLALRPCEERPDGTRLLVVRKIGVAAEEGIVEIPVPRGTLRLEFQGIRWTGLATKLAADRVKLAWVRPPGAPSLPVNGGTDSCWKLVHNAGALTLGFVEATRWELDLPEGDGTETTILMGPGGPAAQRADATASRMK